MGDEDDAWFATLVREHRMVLRAYVSRRIGPDEVDDVVSEVLAAAWRHRDSRPPQPRLWLLRTAQNTLLHQYRTQRRRERLADKLAQLPQTAAGIDATALDGEAGSIVRSCLRQLTDSDQEMLRLAYWEQLTTEEIAYVVGASAVAVRVRLHRARRRLATLLPDWLEPPPLRESTPIPIAGLAPTSASGVKR